MDLDCLAKVLGQKQTPPGLYTCLDKSSFDKSADLDGRDNASSIATFHDRCYNDNVLLSPNESR